MKLYTLPPSPNSIKVVALIHHLGLDVEVQPVDLAGGFHRTPEYLALNPNGLMPTLTDGDFSLWESNAILIYLASKAPGCSVWPQEARAQADVLRWIFWSGSHLGAACRPYLYERMMKPRMLGLAPDEDKVKEGEPALLATLKLLDDHLARSPYLAGEELTLADFVGASVLCYAAPARMPLEGFPHLRRWMDLVHGLPAWQAAMPRPAAAAH